MKELTIEEKAKRYDEAIDKVAYFIKKHIGFGCMIHPNSSEAKELFNIFPELTESEDEMIRKAMIKCFKWLQDEARWTDVYGSTFDSIFAWLENQGEKTSDKTLIEKACKWIKDNIKNYTITDIDDKYIGIDGLFIKDFRKAMEE